MQILQDPKFIELHKTQIYDFLFCRKIGVDLKGNVVYEGVNKFRQHFAVKFIQIPQIIKLKQYLDEPFIYSGSNSQYIQPVRDFTIMQGFRNIMTVMDINDCTLVDKISDSNFTLQERFDIIKQIGLGIQYMHIEKKSAIKHLRPQAILFYEQKNLNISSEVTKKIKIGCYASILSSEEFIKDFLNKNGKQNIQLNSQNVEISEEWLYLYDAPEISHDQRHDNSFNDPVIYSSLPKHYQYNANYNEQKSFQKTSLSALAQKAINPNIPHDEYEKMRGFNFMTNRNMNTYSKKSDIWVYGIIIVEVLLGKHFKQILVEIRADSDPAIREKEDFPLLVLRDFPERQKNQENRLRELLLTMLCCNPHKRPSISDVLRMLEVIHQEIESSAYLDNNLFNNLNLSKLRLHSKPNNIRKCSQCTSDINRQCDDFSHPFNSIIENINFVLPPTKLKQDNFDMFIQCGDKWKNYDYEEPDRNNNYMKNKQQLKIDSNQIKLQKNEIDYRTIIEIEREQKKYQEQKRNGIYSNQPQFYPVPKNNGTLINIEQKIQSNNLPECLDYHELMHHKLQNESNFSKCWFRPSEKSYYSGILNLRYMNIENRLPKPLLPRSNKLHSLYLSHNNIKVLELFEDFPKSSDNYFYSESLKILDLSNNLIFDLKGLEILTNLEELYLSNNEIALLKPQKQVLKMEIQGDLLYYQYERQIQISNTIVLSQLKLIQYLNLSKNKVNVFQKGQENCLAYILQKLQDLEIIDLRYNCSQVQEKQRQNFEQYLGQILTRNTTIIID